MAVGYVVTETIENALPKQGDYPLLNGDLLVLEDDGTYTKECPGLAIGGAVLTDEQKATLREVSFTVRGLNYMISETA